MAIRIFHETDFYEPQTPAAAINRNREELNSLLNDGYKVVATFPGWMAGEPVFGMMILHKPDDTDDETIWDAPDHKQEDLRDVERVSILADKLADITERAEGQIEHIKRNVWDLMDDINHKETD